LNTLASGRADDDPIKRHIGGSMRVKEQILNAVKELPSDASFEDAMERLYLLYKIERGIAQANAGETVTHEEARERMKKWLR